MRTLVYKRTHVGDPGEDGVFGCNGCMRSVRGRKFDAVIGIGGTSNDPQMAGIAKKVTWIGIGAHENGLSPKDGFPLISGR